MLCARHLAPGQGDSWKSLALQLTPPAPIPAGGEELAPCFSPLPQHPQNKA